MSIWNREELLAYIAELKVAYARAWAMYQAFTLPLVEDLGQKHIVNDAACKSLYSILEKHGYLEGDGGEFDFIASPWQKWDAYYHTLTTVADKLPWVALRDGLAACSGPQFDRTPCQT